MGSCDFSSLYFNQEASSLFSYFRITKGTSFTEESLPGPESCLTANEILGPTLEGIQSVGQRAASEWLPWVESRMIRTPGRLGEGRTEIKEQRKNQCVDRHPYNLGFIVFWVNICVQSFGLRLSSSSATWSFGTKSRFKGFYSHSTYCFSRT